MSGERDWGQIRGYFLINEINDGFEGSWKSNCSFDDDGILIVDYGKERGVQYNPGTIAQYIIYAHEKFIKSEDVKWKKIMLKHADWLIENAERENGLCLWRYNFDWVAPGYNLKRGWISGLAQGMCISALVRAYELSEKQVYLDAAGEGLAVYTIPVSKGGILRRSKYGGYWYEEYAGEKSAQVLNGMMFAIIGTHEYYLMTGDKKAKKLADVGVRTLRSELKYFDLDLGFFKWSRYDNKFLILSREYHNIHIIQLEYLVGYYDVKVFRRYIKKWKRSLARFDSSATFGFANFVYSKYLKLISFLERRGYF